MSYFTAKLTPGQKSQLKRLRDEQKGFTVVTNGQTTFVYRETQHGTVEFASSVDLDEREGFRKKTGEYHARLSVYAIVTLTLTACDFHCMLRDVFHIHTED